MNKFLQLGISSVTFFPLTEVLGWKTDIRFKLLTNLRRKANYRWSMSDNNKFTIDKSKQLFAFSSPVL